MSLGGDLASITDRFENERIIAHLDQIGIDENIWIGANDIKDEGNFEWSDGNAFSFSNWYQEEPNNQGDEDCVNLKPVRKWNDQTCSSKLAFICKFLD